MPEVRKFFKFTHFSHFLKIEELRMTGKPFIMMGLIKIWGVLKSSGNFLFRGMKKKLKSLILRDIFHPQRWPILKFYQKISKKSLQKTYENIFVHNFFLKI